MDFDILDYFLLFSSSVVLSNEWVTNDTQTSRINMLMSVIKQDMNTLQTEIKLLEEFNRSHRGAYESVGSRKAESFLHHHGLCFIHRLLPIFS